MSTKSRIFLYQQGLFQRKIFGALCTVVLFFKVSKLSEASATRGRGKKNIFFAILDHGKPWVGMDLKTKKLMHPTA